MVAKICRVSSGQNYATSKYQPSDFHMIKSVQSNLAKGRIADAHPPLQSSRFTVHDVLSSLAVANALVRCRCYCWVGEQYAITLIRRHVITAGTYPPWKVSLPVGDLESHLIQDSFSSLESASPNGISIDSVVFALITRAPNTRVASTHCVWAMRPKMSL